MGWACGVFYIRGHWGNRTHAEPLALALALALALDPPEETWRCLCFAFRPPSRTVLSSRTLP